MFDDVAAKTLETVLNKYIQLDPNSKAALAPLAGKLIRIELTQPPLGFFLLFQEERVLVKSETLREPDTIISGTPFALFSLSVNENKTKILFSDDITFRGDLELGQQVQDFLKNIHIDWEEHLSNCVGDTVAHGIGNVISGLLNWGKGTCESFQENMRDYIQEEVQLVVGRNELDDFSEEVDKLRDHLERITARIQKLEESNSP